MTITRDDAARALGEVESAQGRALRANAYAQASPFFIIWGLVWLAADLASQFAPGFAYAWAIATAFGVVAHLVVSIRQRSQVSPSAFPAAARFLLWRNFATFLLMVVFFGALFVVIRPTTIREVHSVYGLVFGFLYAAVGLWVGRRVLALGLALTVLTMVGYFAVGGWYLLYMGVVTGGAFILGGLWMRRV
jgi:hypothetical protein